MQGILKRIWRWLKNLFGGLFSSQSSQTYLPRRRRGEEPNALPALTDTEYEFLFMQLMEGIGHGWHEGRILKFFEKLGVRGKQKPWVTWLEKFGEKLLNAPSPNQLLASRMIRFGELAQTVPKIRLIGETSYQVGRQLYSKNQTNSIWEFEGPDVPVTSSAPTVDSDNSPATSPDGETLSLDELFARLQTDLNLAQALAQQLGLQTANAQDIIDGLVQQFQAGQEQIELHKTPETVDEWFEMGLKQADLAHWEAAIASWEQAIALNPNLPAIWHNRGQALAQLNRLEEALESFDRALELDGDDDEIWLSRGSVLFSLQRWADSLICWEKIIEIKPDYYPAWYNKGFTLENLGQKQEAIPCYQKALEIEPNFELARVKLNDLLGENN